MTFKTLALISASALTLAACAQQEEPQPMAASTTPIYAKDGTIIGERPVVAPSDDDDLVSGDIEPVDSVLEPDFSEDD
ncbi:hypothetical protein FIU97_15210 [Roseivivax sp. THAF40]|uniref:hypothetical protein n=1 Tax=unclassified Roseivivax TaxID=2639302 RepID=UPI001267A27A|nr:MULTISPECIES: hypothetical protein [unclassified Roseivivax]QFS84101.1 hypothetical protein FIV09_14800 [Roseivivax sp. THAF197b]QFT47928.1 hypothetical protein FIU97_15210 [Roseivivax sp. THAF40]